MAQGKAVCLDFKSGKSRGAGYERTSHAVQATVCEREINTCLSQKKGSDKQMTHPCNWEMIPVGKKIE